MAKREKKPSAQKPASKSKSAAPQRAGKAKSAGSDRLSELQRLIDLMVDKARTPSSGVTITVRKSN